MGVGEPRGLREPRGPSHKSRPLPRSEQKLLPKISKEFQFRDWLCSRAQGGHARQRSLCVGTGQWRVKVIRSRAALPHNELTGYSSEAKYQDQGRECYLWLKYRLL